MSGENEKNIINETNEEKSYYLIFKFLTKPNGCKVKVSLSPNDTVDEFIKKITPFFYDQNYFECDGDGNEAIGRLSHNYNTLVTKDDALKPLYQTSLWNAIKEATTEKKEYTLDIGIRIAQNLGDANWVIKYKPETFGELPLYEVGSVEEAADPSEKHNQFQETGEVVGLSLSPRLVKYKSPHMSASNPLYRFIYSNHLQRQYDEGRLANAEGIFNRKLAFSEKKNVIENGKVKTVTIEQRGWQGIDTSKYLGVNGDWAADEDARAWYEKLDDIILDKAYLSVNENLDTLISAANDCYKNGKITFEQFTNVILMLRYAYELRKLPNDKDADTINSDPAPIKLSVKSTSIISSIFQEINKKFVSKFDEINDLISSSNPTLEGVNNESNLLNSSAAINSNPDRENGNNTGLQSVDEQRFVFLMNFVLQNKERENEIVSKLRNAERDYINTLTDILKSKENKKCVYDLGKEGTGYNYYEPERKCVPDSKTIGKCVSKVNEIWKSVDSIGEFIKQLKDKNEGRIDYQLKFEGYRDPHYEFYIFPLLSEDEETRLSKIKDRIDDASNELDKYQNSSNAKAVKKCKKYVEMYGCLKHVQYYTSKVDSELTTVQWFINLLLSFFHVLGYRYYEEFEVRIDSVVNFQEEKNDVFSKFNKIDLDRYRLTDEDYKRRMNDIYDECY